MQSYGGTGGGVLDTLGGSQPHPGPYMKAARGPLSDWLDRHPELPGEFVQQILATQGQAIGAQIDQRQQNRQDFTGMLTSAAIQPGMTPEMLRALASTSAPKLAAKPFAQNALDQLSGALPETPSGGLAPEDIASIQTSVATLSADEANTLNDAIMATTQAARAGGAPQEVLDAMKKYITYLWGKAKGWYPADSSTPQTTPLGNRNDSQMTNALQETPLGFLFGGNN